MYFLDHSCVIFLLYTQIQILNTYFNPLKAHTPVLSSVIKWSSFRCCVVFRTMTQVHSRGCRLGRGWGGRCVCVCVCVCLCVRGEWVHNSPFVFACGWTSCGVHLMRVCACVKGTPCYGVCRACGRHSCTSNAKTTDPNQRKSNA